jgi:hypothetical protein
VGDLRVEVEDGGGDLGGPLGEVGEVTLLLAWAESGPDVGEVCDAIDSAVRVLVDDSESLLILAEDFQLCDNSTLGVVPVDWARARG